MGDRDALRQWAVVGAVAGGILSGATGEYGTAQDSESLLVPADWAFAIWGPVYGGIIAYTVHQARPAARADPLLRRTGPAAAGAVALSGLWVRTQGTPWLQLPVIAVTAAAAGTACARAAPADDAERDSAAARWLVRAPLGLFAGWISLATVVATVEALIAAGAVPSGPGRELRDALLLAATAAAAGTVTARRAVPATYPAAVAWGLVGVAARTRGTHRLPAAAALAGAAAVTAAALRSTAGPRPA
ncbi:hypothetical protein ACT4S5_16165 [Kocuria oceani]|uniref:hypothetical protein n=1 Tax=Kocuria oceani TaxID=988827 RepID=UPI004036A16E